MIIIQFQLRSIIKEHDLLKIYTENEGERKKIIGLDKITINLTYVCWKIGSFTHFLYQVRLL